LKEDVLEKYGVECDDLKKEKGIKTASPSCEHPKEAISRDGTTEFCNKCGKYLK